MSKPTVRVVCPLNRQQWREWLQAHHDQHQSVWLVYYKKASATPTLTWSEAVDEALCFGWIDSQAKPLDKEKYQQLFSRRKPKSGWSKVNKDKIERLLATGQMAPAGLARMEAARQDGSWTLLDEVEQLVVPADLAAALQAQPPAMAFFASLSRTDRRNLLQWLVLARRADTRQRRLAAIAELAARQQKPTQFGGRRRAAS
jgi:uncharacterized protein YdeI (YjbR/CyaY-like superfamily)